MIKFYASMKLRHKIKTNRMKAAHYSHKQKAWIEANQKQFYTMARKYIDAQLKKEQSKKPKAVKIDDGLTPFERMQKRRIELIEKSTPSELAFYELMDLLDVPYEKQYPIRLHGFLYFADIYFPQVQLVVEIDGKYHDTEKQKTKDYYRTLHLEQNGYKVRRFKNEDVDDINFIFTTLEVFGIKVDARLYV